MQFLSDDRKVGALINIYYHVGAFGPYNSDDCCVTHRQPNGEFEYSALHRDRWLRFDTYSDAVKFIETLDPKNGYDHGIFEFTIWEMAEHEVTMIGTELKHREKINLCLLD